MDIFESLENLPVSESCFEDIIGLVEAMLSESMFGTYSGPANVESVKQALRAKYKPEKATAGDKYFLKDKLEWNAETPVTKTEDYAHSASKHYKKELKRADSKLKKAQSNLQNVNKGGSCRLKKSRAAAKVIGAEKDLQNLKNKKEIADNLLKATKYLNDMKHPMYHDDGNGSAQVHRKLHGTLARALGINQN